MSINKSVFAESCFWQRFPDEIDSDIDVTSKVTLFEVGADDYIVQPFDALEMLARLRAVIRRCQLILGRR